MGGKGATIASDGAKKTSAGKLDSAISCISTAARNLIIATFDDVPAMVVAGVDSPAESTRKSFKRWATQRHSFSGDSLIF